MINVVVEGRSDEQVARAVVHAAGHEVAKIVVKNGKRRLDRLLANYNRAATHAPWVILRDSDAQCPASLRATLMAGIDNVSPLFHLRIAHPMSEGWLLADNQGFADFFHVKASQIPADPESLQNAKQTVLNLCSKSRSRSLRRDMVVSGDKVGPLYTVRIGEFAAKRWNVDSASTRSPSLRRAIERISSIPQSNHGGP
ncbi:Conserved protein of unknown function [Mycobacterium canettii CIPT 140070017]|nr:Conserved protein of unknown function [Mycobacterium canettii CIPT 140070017]